jgi:hypothetical protein
MKKILAFIAAFSLFVLASTAFAATVTVSWTNVAGNDGYVVQVKTDTCASAAIWGTFGNVGVDVIVFQGGNYGALQPLCFRVSALKPGGIIQTWSTPVDFVIPGPLPAPNPVTVTSP